MTTPTKPPAEVLAELIALRNQAGATLYQRLKLAQQLLADKAWVEDSGGGGGDYGKALDRLEADCFGPEAGMTLAGMLEVLQAVPDEKTWKVHRYNLRRMLEERRARQQARQASVGGPFNGRNRGTGATPSQEAEATPASETARLKQELRQARQTIRAQTKEIRHLRRAVAKLRAALTELQSV